LWVTKEIIERHGGSIQVMSRNSGSHGAIVAIVLPALPAHPDEKAAPARH
jgi:nitrogen fixation/metabolism regulation signal transduction histidine kinase